jgi:hypothetical protein
MRKTIPVKKIIRQIDFFSQLGLDRQKAARRMGKNTLGYWQIMAEADAYLFCAAALAHRIGLASFWHSRPNTLPQLHSHD